MRVVEADSLESVNSYRLVERVRPVASAGEVIIRIEACGVGYVDALVALGRYQVKPPLPHTPGSEVGGVVEATGDGVTALRPGQRVMAQVRGGFAEYAVASAAAVAAIPDAMRFEQAAGFRVNYLTALHGLMGRAALREGETLLVRGAGGGVGLAAVQIGALLGAKVIASASTEAKRAAALANGATVVIDTVAEGWRDRLKALAPHGVDVAFDPVCGALFEPAFRSLAWGGRHLVVGFTGGAIPALPANLPLMKGAGLLGVDVRQFLLFEQAKASEHLATLLGWVETGRLDPVVGRTFAMTDFGAALEFALSGEGVGKTILRVGS